jgi:OmcA/MtrC family decaheme c-type cytochrome
LKKLLAFMGIFCLIVPLVFLGCEGDDGAQGPAGAPGPPGPPGPPGVANQVETCNICHVDGDVAAAHAATLTEAIRGVATVTNVEAVAGSIVITFNATVDGVANDSFDLRRAYVHFDNAALADNTLTVPQLTTFQRDTITDNVTMVSGGSGNYTITVPDDFEIANATYLFQLTLGLPTQDDVRPIIIVDWAGGSPLRDHVTNEGCNGCHGPYPAWSEKFRHYAVGGPDCQICHAQATRTTQVIYPDDTRTFVVEDNVAFGTNLTEYIHGIHNSHNMPPDRVYYRTAEPDATADAEDRYSVGYPSDMRNCKVCHSTEAQREAAASAPVSYYLCMTCHKNWDGFVAHSTGEPIFADTDTHRNLTKDTDCTVCHRVGGLAPSFVETSDFHNYFESVDTHYDSFYRGTDISFDNPDNVAFAITGVTVSGDNVAFTWTAEKLGAAVDPCNDNTNDGPTFQQLGAYLAYAKGDDWVNEFVGSSPGQPAGARNLFTSLSTVCDNTNVATTTGLQLAAGTDYAKTVLLAIGGKPVDRFAPADEDTYIRVPSPTYAFNRANGSAAAARRDAVNTEKCLACHQGTLYQHGGDRVDNEQLCVICHNPSSADKNNRLDRFQIVDADGNVNTAATYDGKANESYDMRVMIHAIHGIEKRQNPWVVYRSRGVYAFVLPGTEPPSNWPLDNNGNLVTAPEELLDAPIGGSTNGSVNRHVWTIIHYPKPANECLACHNAGAYEVPDQTKAVALTVDPGTSYTDQSDDIVIGPTQAACIQCHAGAAPASHTASFGYEGNFLKEDLLELAGP